MGEKKQKQSGDPGLTVNDVARRAGVSKTAVSYVLNEQGQRNKHVSEETRTKVLQAIQELNFHPHALARALSTGKSQELVVIMDNTFTYLAMELTASFQREALLHGYTPVWYLTQGFSTEQKEALYQSLFARHPIGIFTSPTAFTSEDVARAQHMGVEHIIFFSFRVEQIEHTHSIVFPSHALGYLAAQHLLERGHNHLALIQPDDDIQKLAFAQRLAGMQDALKSHVNCTLDIIPLPLSAAAAYPILKNIFIHTVHPTGIYAFNDEYALVLLATLTRLGIRVPEQVALLGTDNLALGNLVWPPLTSISFDTLNIGKRAVDMFAILQQRLPLPEELTRPLVPHLILREST